jgi:secreted trypsin-like serine protease
MVSLLVVIALFGSAFAIPPNDDTCGMPAIAPAPGNSFKDGRIVGGKEAKPNSWPWQVQIRYNGGHYCGASLLSNDWIITAAHCLRGNSPSGFSFRLGRHSKTGTEASEQIASAATVIIHEAYSPLTINNDVGVIRITPTLTSTPQVSAVCLPKALTELPDDHNVHVTGWGATEGTCCATVLKQVMVPIVNRDKCNQADYYNGAIRPGMICAGLDAGGLDSCQGDSGGPLVSQVPAGSGPWQLFGIVSWGSGCADPKKPGVYTNVVYYDAWIRSKVAALEREIQEVAGKFRPAPRGAAFREASREMVRNGEVQKSDLPMNGEWLE